jgi:hypothetical protein
MAREAMARTNVMVQLREEMTHIEKAKNIEKNCTFGHAQDKGCGEFIRHG